MNERITVSLQKLSTDLKIKMKLRNSAYNVCHNIDSVNQSNIILSHASSLSILQIKLTLSI